jgi:hypothetical protein
MADAAWQCLVPGLNTRDFVQVTAQGLWGVALLHCCTFHFNFVCVCPLSFAWLLVGHPRRTSGSIMVVSSRRLLTVPAGVALGTAEASSASAQAFSARCCAWTVHVHSTQACSLRHCFSAITSDAGGLHLPSSNAAAAAKHAAVKHPLRCSLLHGCRTAQSYPVSCVRLATQFL